MYTISNYLRELADLLDRVPLSTIRSVVDELVRAQREGRKIFLLGNGGSAATASHIACDLAKGTATLGHRRLRVIALTDNVPLITAWANDTAYENAFAEQLRNLVEAGDVVIAISGSGNSPNVLRAVKVAREAGARTIGLTGFSGGKLASMVDLPVVVPGRTIQHVEDVHLALGHAIFHALCQKLG